MFTLQDLLSLSKIYIYEDFPNFNIKLFENDGIQISKNEIFKYKNLDSISQNIVANIKNLIIGKEIKLKITPFGNNINSKFYSTSEQVLEPYLHYRLLTHPNRVANIQDADLAFIPFYSHLLKFATKNGNIIPLNTIIQYTNSLLPKTTNTNIPHLIAYSDLGYNTKEALREMFKFAPNNFYFVCYEEDQSSSGYYLPKKAPSRVITVPYMSIIHKSKFENFYENFKIMKNRTFFTCHVGNLNRWPIQYMSKYLSTPFYTSLSNEQASNLGNLIEFYSNCKFSIHISSLDGEMRISRHFYTSLTTGTIPILFNSNEMSYSSLFRGALDLEMMAIIIPNSIHQIRDEKEQSWAIINYLKSIPLNVFEKKRRFIYDHLQYLQYSMENDQQDAISLIIGSVVKLNSILI
ncbi:predicted protein [Naegleria gruberi]|uniref:Predicted protein n=1 Tax=Naegleria gruberi TaxID=5762 RepID=D2VYP8_NAEGR|nr:uncharacterized protein NAEGRDRAFT_74197 [Naegleria gruberi]EFC38097.1 predicted protein [Naegleria gruberi]|eukprot:XP_002670841.1 predicted protein [Naegleria gruberi strain NEG-M]